MSNDIQAEADTASAPMTLGKGVGLYLMALAIMFGLIALTIDVRAFPGIVACISYLVLGFIMNRVVLRGLIEWHPMYNTLANVSSAKLGMLLLWPIRYPVLFFQLFVSKHL